MFLLPAVLTSGRVRRDHREITVGKMILRNGIMTGAGLAASWSVGLPRGSNASKGKVFKADSDPDSEPFSSAVLKASLIFQFFGGMSIFKAWEYFNKKAINTD